jgi:hypothetical protein
MASAKQKCYGLRMTRPALLDRTAPKSATYEADLYTWAMEQAAKLRSGDPDIDIDNIAEELETLGRSEARSLQSAYRVLLLHLLKWHYQPELRRASRSWRATIVTQRNDIEEILERNPGLKSQEQDLFLRAYDHARKEAAAETGIPIAKFPETCPWIRDQTKDEAFPADLWSEND